jgi:hypothetical protein
MQEFLSKIEQLAPQWFLALVAVAGAIAFMLYYDPPHNLCDTQKQSYVAEQKKFLAGSEYNLFFEQCLRSNSRGGCTPYFDGFKKALNDFQVLDPQCFNVIANGGTIRSTFSSFLVQTTRLAWGDNGPESIHVRESWLGPSQLRIFCRVKNFYINNYGDDKYIVFRNGVLKKLPNKRKLKNVEIKDLSLFALPCERYF